MANRAHLLKLGRADVDWNQWRIDHPEITPDLSGADLSQAFLLHMDLSKADLRKATLDKTVLVMADLREAKLGGTDLSKAFLSDDFPVYDQMRTAKVRGATYDDNTIWPDGFDPVVRGAVKVD